MAVPLLGSPFLGELGKDTHSPYLFILVSQNLTVILNFALRHHMIPSFNANLRHKFNHLMYVNDLILISHASRKTARYIKMCLFIYGHLTSQHPSTSKSKIFFPTWFSENIIKSIYCILSYRDGSFSFTYLGILISTKNLAVSHFNSMLDRIDRTISN